MIVLLHPRSVRRAANRRFPLSILSLAAVLEGRERYEIVDANMDPDPRRTLSELAERDGVELGVRAEGAQERRARAVNDNGACAGLVFTAHGHEWVLLKRKQSFGDKCVPKWKFGNEDIQLIPLFVVPPSGGLDFLPAKTKSDA